MGRIPLDLSGLQAAAAELYELSGSLNDQIAELEAQLNALHAGGRTDIELKDKARVLSYAKFHDKWGLYVVRLIDGRPLPLREAGRAERMESITLFPALITAMEQDVREKVKALSLVLDDGAS